MDNPQHYQPLSHALHPPLAHPHSHQSAHYSEFQSGSRNTSRSPVEEEEEEEEEEDDDEGMVEEQLDLMHPPSNPTSPQLADRQTQNARCVPDSCIKLLAYKFVQQTRKQRKRDIAPTHPFSIPISLTNAFPISARAKFTPKSELVAPKPYSERRRSVSPAETTARSSAGIEEQDEQGQTG